MELWKATSLALTVIDTLVLICDKITIGGAIRRQCAEVNEIEVLAICRDKSLIGALLDFKRVTDYHADILLQGVNLRIYFCADHDWARMLAMVTAALSYLSKRWLPVGKKGAG